MKKSLLALAVLGAFAGAASAQTNVTVYGVADASIMYKNNDAGTVWGVGSGQQSGNRLGFKGSEDLGNGLSAIFTLENGFNIDDGNQGNGGRLFGRQAWVGLQGGFGAVKLGRQQTPIYDAIIAVDPFHGAVMASAQNFFGSGGYVQDPFLRSDNTLSYASPNFGGFKGTVAYAFGEQADNFAQSRSEQLGGSYVNGPLNVQLAYQKSTNPSLKLNGAAAATALDDAKTTLIGGSYDFGMVKPYFAFADSKATTGATSTKTRNWLLGATVPVGQAGELMASWMRNDIRDLDNGTANQYAVGYSHKLSKRTNVYTAYTYNTNDDASALNDGGKLGGSQRMLNVGIRHLF